MAMALLCRDTTSRSLPALGAAGEEDNRCADEKENHGCKTSPHADAVVCVRAAAVFVDVVFDDLGEETAVSACVWEKWIECLRIVVDCEELTPNTTKSMTMTTNVMIHASRAMSIPTMLPKKPPNAKIAAMNANPQAIGWRMKALVRPFVLSVLARLKLVPSTWLMISAIL